MFREVVHGSVGTNRVRRRFEQTVTVVLERGSEECEVVEPLVRKQFPHMVKYADVVYRHQDCETRTDHESLAKGP